MIRLKQILVPTDFSEPSDAALNYGRELARAFGAHLRILNVVDKLMATVVGPEGYIVGNLMEMQCDVEEAARNQLEALIKRRGSSRSGGEARSSHIEHSGACHCQPRQGSRH